MAKFPAPSRDAFLRWKTNQFWSGDLSLTLITISLVILVFVVTPLREAGLPGRLVLDLVIAILMVFGAIAIGQSRIATILVISLVLATSVVLGAGRLCPTPSLHKVGSVLATVTLLLYVRIVLIGMFRGGPMTWSRIQGGVSAYLLLGMAWASAYQVVEQFHPGSFHFVVTPTNFDQLSPSLPISALAS
jgi:hypothetical protein